jgi:hypothetical protein
MAFQRLIRPMAIACSVEDGHTNKSGHQKLAAFYLRRNKYRGEPARNGWEAVERGSTTVFWSKSAQINSELSGILSITQAVAR